MDRQEFGTMLKKARHESGVSLKKICVKMDCMSKDITLIESARHSFSMKKCFTFLKNIDFALVIYKEDKGWYLDNDLQLAKWLKYNREKLGNSQMDLSKLTGFTRSVFSSIENGKTTMSIDVFLKLCEVFGYQVSLVKNQEQSNCQQ